VSKKAIRHSFKDIPLHYHTEYREKERLHFKSRLNLFCPLAVLIYFFMAALYLMRSLILPEAFDNREVVIWFLLIVCTAAVMYLNSKSKSIWKSKRYAYLYNGCLVTVVMLVGLLYVESFVVFSFYFALVLFLSALTLPWKTSDTFILTLIYIAGFTIYYAFVILVLHLPVITFPRFEPFTDGMVFLVTAGAFFFLFRKKEMERDIENFILLKDVESKGKQIDRELQLADRVHRTLIPESLVSEKIDIHICYVPMSHVGGDYANFKFLDDKRLIFIISDVTGHGVPAALLVNRFHAEFERLAEEGREPGHLLKHLDAFISKGFEGTGMFLSAYCGLLDFKAMKLLYSNYGHPSQYLCQNPKNQIRSMTSLTHPLGLSLGGEDLNIYQTETKVNRGDRILLFTDGVIEAANAKGELYGSENLKHYFKNNVHLKGGLFNEQLLAELKSYQSGPFNDDVFILDLLIK
jgi:hypothetical protein